MREGVISVNDSELKIHGTKASWLTRFLDQMLPYFHHGYPKRFSSFALFGAAFGYGVFATATTLQSQVEPVSMFGNFVSSLGWGPNGSDEVFKYGLILVGAILLPYLLFLVSFIRNHAAPQHREMTIKLTHQAVAFWLPAVVGLWTLALFVDIRVPSFNALLAIGALHMVGAITYFTCSIFGSFFLTRALALNGSPHKLQYGLLGFIVFSTVAMIVGPIFGSSATNVSRVYQAAMAQGIQFPATPSERVRFISEMTKAMPWAAFFEWMVVLSMLAWFAVTGVQTFFHKPQRSGLE
jgi:hypothetical protein